MRDHSHHIELTREEAVAGMLRLIDEADAFKPRVEQVSVADSIGRVLARDAVAQVDVPDCLTCNNEFGRSALERVRRLRSQSAA